MDIFIYPFLLDEKERYVLWFTDDVDGLLTRNGKIAAFSSIDAARAFAFDREHPVALQISLPLDLRWIVQDSLTSDNLDCVETLNAWNFFADVAASLPDKKASFIALDKREHVIYEKLFWGNNLPAVTPSGQRFDPTWSEDDLIKMGSILNIGLELFVSNLE